MSQMQTAHPSFLPHYALEAVPRYTSYPPATGFSTGVSGEDWQAWMRESDPDPDVSLYLHIPFCKSMCWYCGCHTTIPNKRARIERYLEALHEEIESRAAQLPSGHTVRHVHFGGGSPDMLTAEEARTLLALLHAEFNIAPGAEIAFELDPRGVTKELATAIAEGGANRVSLGVQDLDADVQALIHRIQSRSTVQSAVEILRSADIPRINLDMMYGLPAQTEAHVRHTAQSVADLGADRVAVFGYAHVPWFKKHQKAIPEDRLPGAKERFNQMLVAADTLSEAGYQAIGFDHFARPDDRLAIAARSGGLRRNFQGFTDDDYDILVGLGASAISEAPQGYVQNQPDPTGYARAVQANGHAGCRGLARSTEECDLGARIETLMCRNSLARSALRPGDLERLQPLLDDQLITLSDTALEVPVTARPYIRNIAARLDPNFQPAEARHSQAV